MTHTNPIQNGCNINESLCSIVLDLDDTILETTKQLVEPADEQWIDLVRTQLSPIVAEKLSSLITTIRSEAPELLDHILEQTFGSQCTQIRTLQRYVLSNIDLRNISISIETRNLLHYLSQNTSLYLITEGDAQFQSKKIDFLSLEQYFEDIYVVTPTADHSAKRRALEQVAHKEWKSRDQICTIGNRVDKEIKAAIDLGMRAILVRNGEGRLAPCPQPNTPTLNKFEDLWGALYLINVSCP